MSERGENVVRDNGVHGLRVERFVDPVTGDNKENYIWNNIPVPKIKLTGRIAEQVSGLSLIQKDLENAKKWVERALALTSELDEASEAVSYVHCQDRERADDAKAFFVAGLTFYAKAFTKATGRRVQIQRNSLAPEFQELHDYYMEFRHNFAAHSGDLKLEYATSYLLLIPDSRGTGLRLATTRVQPDVVSAKDNEKSFLVLLEHAITIVKNKYFQAGKRLVDAAATRAEILWQAAAQSSISVDMDNVVKGVNDSRGNQFSSEM